MSSFRYASLKGAWTDSTDEYIPKFRNSQVFDEQYFADLGLVDYIFSDKTGTLTSNEMQLRLLAIKESSFGTVDFRYCTSSFSNQPLAPFQKLKKHFQIANSCLLYCAKTLQIKIDEFCVNLFCLSLVCDLHAAKHKNSLHKFQGRLNPKIGVSILALKMKYIGNLTIQNFG